MSHQPQFIKTCFFPLFPFLFPFPPSPSPSTSPLSDPILPLPLAPPAPQAFATCAPPSRLTMPLPYPKIVDCGLAAGGRAGNSPPLLTGPRLAGLLAGGVALADPGLEDGAEEAAQGTVLTFVDVAFDRVDGGGRVGKGLFVVVEEEEMEDMGGDAVPQDRVWETEERDDCAVLDFSFKTLVDFVLVGVLVFEEDELAVVTAQFSGIAEEELPLAAGREG